MAKIFWLASYPKSGNTWMRIFLTNYVRDTSTAIDINKLDSGHIASSRAWFDEWAGVEASALDDATIERLRPGVYRCLAHESQKDMYVKVHDSWKQTDRHEGLFPAEVTGGVIYILRNPLDMVSSCANHWGLSAEEAAAYLCDPLYALSQKPGEMSEQLRQWMGSWSHHVTSWLDESGLPVLLVRYEDLHRDPESFFGNVIRFCRLPWNVERIRRAIAFSAFSELQRQEQTKDFSEKLAQARSPFFRKGQAGSWREELPAHLVQRLIDVHGETMRRFGYLDGNNQPV